MFNYYTIKNVGPEKDQINNSLLFLIIVYVAGPQKDEKI